MTRGRRAEIALWSSGLALLALWGAARAYGGWSARHEIRRFNDAVAVAAAPQAGSAAAQAVDTSRWSETRRRRYEEVLPPAPGSAIAVMRIESVGLLVPVLEGTDELTLDRAAGHIEGTPGPGAGGNVGIAGHRDGFFRGLKDVAQGDVIQLRTPAETIDYVVTELRVVAPDDVSVLAPTGAPSLTLVTCYPFYFVGSAPLRYVVRAVRR
jgi:sortase A